MIAQPFNPAFKTTQKITTGAASVSAAALMNPGDNCVRITNLGANAAFVNISSLSTATADATDLVVLANQSVIIYKGDRQYISALQITATTDLYITTGSGGI